MMNKIKATGSKVAVAVVTAFASASAMASEPTTPAADAFAALEAQIGEYLGLAWPIVVALVGGMIGIKLFKKFSNRIS